MMNIDTLNTLKDAVTKFNTTDIRQIEREAEMEILRNKIMGMKIKQGITDGWRMDWLELHPGEIVGVTVSNVKSWIFKGKSYHTQRAAIDEALCIEYSVPVA